MLLQMASGNTYATC